MAQVVKDGRVRTCPRVGIRYSSRDQRLRLGSWDVGKLTGKSIELVKILRKRKINTACVQETKWTGAKATKIDGYKLWYTGASKSKNGVSIIEDSDLRDQVVDVRRVNDRIMDIKLVVGSAPMIVISVYAPHAGLGEEVRGNYGRNWMSWFEGIPKQRGCL